MAFTVTARHAQGPTASSSQTGVTNSTTPTADSLLLVAWASQRDNHSTVESLQTPTGGGWTYTQQAVSAVFAWHTSPGFDIKAMLYSAPVGGSPGAHTVTVDSWSGTNVAFYSTLCADITGHDAGTPVVQTKTNGAQHAGGDAHSGSVTLDATPATGNLVVVTFFAGADNGGGLAAPTIGGQSMTSVHAQSGASNQGCMFQRTVTGAESNAIITCTDLGQTVGNYAAVAVEIAADAGGGGPVSVPAMQVRSGLRLR